MWDECVTEEFNERGGDEKNKSKKNNNNNDLCNINNQCGNVFDNNTDRYC